MGSKCENLKLRCIELIRRWTKQCSEFYYKKCKRRSKQEFEMRKKQVCYLIWSHLHRSSRVKFECLSVVSKESDISSGLRTVEKICMAWLCEKDKQGRMRPCHQAYHQKTNEIWFDTFELFQIQILITHIDFEFRVFDPVDPPLFEAFKYSPGLYWPGATRSDPVLDPVVVFTVSRGESALTRLTRRFYIISVGT